MILEIEGIVFSVIRSDRKSIGITVESNGSPILRVPRTATDLQIRSLVSKRIGWVERKIQYTNENSSKSYNPTFEIGTQLPYLGRFHTLAVGDNSTFGLIKGVFSVPKKSIDEIKEDAMKWYKIRARQYLTSRLEGLQESYGEVPNSTRILDLKGRWASCSQDKTINLNWKLVLLPTKLIDYVLHHEMCHLRIHDHSNRYWRHLQNKCPNWKKLSTELEREAVRFYISSGKNDSPNQSLENDTSS